MNPLKTDRARTRPTVGGGGISLGRTRAKYPHPDEALMVPLTLRYELNDGGCFILGRKLVSPIPVRAGVAVAAVDAATTVGPPAERRSSAF